MPPRRPFKGHDCRLFIAFDLGTTYSGVSYTFLGPGKVPYVQTVYRRVGYHWKNWACISFATDNPVWNRRTRLSLQSSTTIRKVAIAIAGILGWSTSLRLSPVRLRFNITSSYQRVPRVLQWSGP